MRLQKKTFKRLVRKCTAVYRMFAHYQKLVRMAETELDGRLEAC